MYVIVWVASDTENVVDWQTKSWSWGTVRGERTWGGALREAVKPVFSLPQSPAPALVAGEK